MLVTVAVMAAAAAAAAAVTGHDLPTTAGGQIGWATVTTAAATLTGQHGPAAFTLGWATQALILHRRRDCAAVRWWPRGRTGFATTAQARTVLGVARLRAVRSQVRPDLYTGAPLTHRQPQRPTSHRSRIGETP